LRDHDRAELVGTKSFGKGTVQETEEFKDGSGLHVTIAKWLLPSGKNIHGEGIEPDVEVKNDSSETDLQLEKAMAELTK
jgi:carboxyl-terminal processing protease